MKTAGSRTGAAISFIKSSRFYLSGAEKSAPDLFPGLSSDIRATHKAADPSKIDSGEISRLGHLSLWHISL